MTVPTYYSMVFFSTATVGAGNIAVGAPLPNARAPIGIIPDGTLSTYGLQDFNGGFEWGVGTFSGGGTVMARTTVYGSSNGGLPINLSGSAQVNLCLLAENVGTISAQNASAVAITGGTITGVTIPWVDIIGVPASALTIGNDTNVILTLGGTPATALLAAASITAGWTGTLAGARGGTGNGFFAVAGPAASLKTFTFPNASANVLTDNALVTVAQGGIGVGTLASNGVLYGNGTSAVQALAVNASATNKFLTQASSGAPAWNVIAAGDLPIATTGAFGAVKPDGTTITISAGVISSSGGATFANPTGTVGLTAVNGVATTAMRSDAAPPLAASVAARLMPTQYASNGGIVQVGPAATIPGSGAANFGPTAGQTALEFVTIGQLWRIRQNGTVNQFKIRLPATTGITGFYVKIWRLQGTKYDLVGTSANVVGSIAVGTNTIAISIPGVQNGDYIGARVEWSGGASVQNLISVPAADVGSSQHTVIYSVLNTTPASFQYDWVSQTALSGNAITQEVFMAAPIFVAMGDSLTSGFPLTISFLDSANVSPNIVSSYPYFLGNTLGYTCQDVGISGQTTSQMSARFATDVVAKNPKVVVILGGVNDIAASISNATIIANITSMLNAANAAGILPVVIGVAPCRNDTLSPVTNAMMAQRDLLNPLLQALVTGSPYFGIYVSPDPLGVYYSGAGAAANNLWALAPAFDSGDGIHMSVAGYSMLSQLVADAIQSQQGFLTGIGPISTVGPLSVLGNATIGGNVAITGNSVAFGGTITGPIAVSSGTVSSSPSTGAMVLSGSGGIGVGGAGYFGTFVNVPSTSGLFAGMYAIGGTAFIHSYPGGNGTVFIGVGAGNFTNTSAYSIGIGLSALSSVTSGFYNIAVGALALSSVTTSGSNVAVGFSALQFATGDLNVAIGYNTLAGAAGTNTGTSNTAIGYRVMQGITSGGHNFGAGFSALFSLTTGSFNMGIGYGSLQSETTGMENTCVGSSSGSSLNGTNNNTLIGFNAGGSISSGSNNSIMGSYAGTAALANAIVLSDGAGTIRYDYAVTHAAGSTVAGTIWFPGIATAAAGSAVSMSSGQFIINTSSRRFKTNERGISLADMRKVLDLNPVRYNSTCEMDDPNEDHDGLIAEEVFDVFPQFVSFHKGFVSGVRYDQLVVPLIGVIKDQQARIAALEARLH